MQPTNLGDASHRQDRSHRRRELFVDVASCALLLVLHLQAASTSYAWRNGKRSVASDYGSEGSTTIAGARRGNWLDLRGKWT